MKAPQRVYAADFDGDNDLDLLATSNNDAKITWFENVNGLGFYGKQHTITETYSSGVTALIAYPADIDGDGDNDIVTRQGAALFWYENTDGNGNFTITHPINASSGATIIRCGDMDGDGKLDVVVGVYNADKLSWYKNLDGNGTFGPEIVIANINGSGNNGSLTSLEIADIEGNSSLDIIMSSFNGHLDVYKNTDGMGTFSLVHRESIARMQGSYPADIDGDGDKDIVGANTNGGGGSDAVVWYENNGNGNFSVKHHISTLTINGKSITAADIDNDGDIDVISAASNQPKLAWYVNNGNGTFSPRVTIHQLAETDAAQVIVADVDNDGDKDVVSVFNNNSAKEKISVFTNLGTLGNTIQGTVTIDSNANGCTTDDLNGKQLMVVATNGANSFATFTDNYGKYTMPVNTGSFIAKITSDLPTYFVSNPAMHSFNFTGINNNGQANFCVAPTGPVNDVTVTAYPVNEARPGFAAHYRIVYKNKGTQTSGGTIQFVFDSAKMSFTSSTQTVSAQTPNSVTFSYTDLNTFETGYINLIFQVFAPPVTNINDVLVLQATIATPATDATSADNSFELNQTVIGSYDPNDITCLEGSQVFMEDADEYLHYIIRFQNTGTASAINVNVKNMLDSKLDWTTLQLESISHNGRVEIKNGNDVKFVFNNIYLAAMTVDEPASHGFIAYKIKPRQNVSVGDIVNNKADIFFDFNPAIETNTASTEFVEQLSTPDAELAKFTIFPNSTSGLVRVKSNMAIDSLVLFDTNGRTLRNDNFTQATDAQIDLAGLAKGVYILKIQSGNSVKTYKIAKK